MFFAILTSVLSGVVIAIITVSVRKLMKVLNGFRSEFTELKESQRNQIKAQIVQMYQIANYRGYITHMELETVNRLADSYFALGGNNYIHAIMDRLNNMSIRGESIPTE